MYRVLLQFQVQGVFPGLVQAVKFARKLSKYGIAEVTPTTNKGRIICCYRNGKPCDKQLWCK